MISLYVSMDFLLTSFLLGVLDGSFNLIRVPLMAVVYYFVTFAPLTFLSRFLLEPRSLNMSVLARIIDSNFIMI